MGAVKQFAMDHVDDIYNMSVLDFMNKLEDNKISVKDIDDKIDDLIGVIFSKLQEKSCGNCETCICGEPLTESHYSHMAKGY